MLGFMGVMAVVFTGQTSAVPYHAYIAAGQRWLTRAPVYELSNIDGFQYLPQSAAFFSLFARLGEPYADVLWRALCLMAFVSALRRVARLLVPSHAADGFAIATALSIAPVCNALSNGQANLALAALGLHAVAAMATRRDGQLSALLSCGFALKPLLLVPLSLVFALCPKTRLQTVLWLSALGLYPFLTSGSDYAVQQYVDCARKLSACAQPDRLFEDLRSLLWVLNVRPSDAALFVARALFACLVLGVCGLTRRRLSEPLASCSVMALSFGYLMLFNPRTLTTSYVMVVGFAALLATFYWFRSQKLLAATFGVCALVWNLNHHLLPWIEHWLHALACCVFCALLVLQALRSKSAAQLTSGRLWPQTFSPPRLHDDG